MMLLAALVLAAALQDPPQPPKSGKFRGEIVDPASKEVIMKVRMQIPDPPAEGKKWGFIFVCHGFKGSEGNSYLDGTVAALKRCGLDQDYLVVAGKSKAGRLVRGGRRPVLKLFEWVKKTYPVDPERLFLFGSSNGARFVCRFGFAHQDIVKAVVSYCGSYDMSKLPDGDKKVEVVLRPRHEGQSAAVAADVGRAEEAGLPDDGQDPRGLRSHRDLGRQGPSRVEARRRGARRVGEVAERLPAEVGITTKAQRTQSFVAFVLSC
jgi:hypothetical protein